MPFSPPCRRVELTLSIGGIAASSSAEVAGLGTPLPASLRQQEQQSSPALAVGSPRCMLQRRPSPAKSSGLGGSPQKADFTALAEYSRLVEGSTASPDTIPAGRAAAASPHPASPAFATLPPTPPAGSDLS
ncbi:hypothetical protein ABPG77_009263 [Micractinium sp. CCAP 211/92]